MAVDTTLDLCFGGQPFAVVPPTAGETSSLDYALLGVPFVTPDVAEAVYVAEATSASDAVFVYIERAEDTFADVAAGLDLAFNGEPFFLVGAGDTFTLDWAFGGRPFVISTVPFTGKMQPSIKIFSDPQML
jgi:hypothetical protein